MKKILVTGANGQVGQVLQSIAHHFTGICFVFMESKQLDITNNAQVEEIFEKECPDYCFNLAAYTAVDNAEDNVELAYTINAEGVLNLVEVCNKVGSILVHLSTDFVFDGQKTTPYTIIDIPNPINVYGASKLKGEEYIKSRAAQYYIVRTSWVYSDYGHNFKKTMLKLSETKKEISVVNDQIGCPTNAEDLCYFLMELIQEKRSFGVYHYRGEFICSWYDFALLIFKQYNIEMKVNPISSASYPAKALRPKYSVLG